MHRDGSAEVSSADDDYLVVLVKTEDMPDLTSKLRHVVAVALLTESAEAVEILTDLRSCKPHFLRQLTGGDLLNILVEQLAEETVVPRQSAYD